MGHISKTGHDTTLPHRRVLLVAHDFPPGGGIGGGLRSSSFARHLPAFGWWPEVVALDGGQPQLPGVVRLPSPTPWHRPYEVGPYGWAYALHRHLRRSTAAFDLAYVSCPPFPQALAAAAFAHARGIPLVVDFRDAWTLDPYQEGSRLKRLLYRHIFPRWERRLLRQTDLLILNTPSALRAYRDLYPQWAKKMCLLPNGFDEEAFTAAPPAMQGDELVLLYAGRFGIGARSPERLLAGLAMARRAGHAVRLEIVGDQPASVVQQIRAIGDDQGVSLRQQVEHRQMVAEICAAGALVLIQAPADAPVQAVAGKTYDYLRAGRPILFVGPEGDNAELIRCHAARYEHPEDDPAAIAAAIARLHRDWQAGRLSERRVSAAFMTTYGRRQQTAQLANHFTRLVQGGSA